MTDAYKLLVAAQVALYDLLAAAQEALPGLRAGNDVVVNTNIRDAESYISAALTSLRKAEHAAAAATALPALTEAAA